MAAIAVVDWDHSVITSSLVVHLGPPPDSIIKSINAAGSVAAGNDGGDEGDDDGGADVNEDTDSALDTTGSRRADHWGRGGRRGNSPDEQLPTGTLASLEKRLAVVQTKEEQAKQNVAASLDRAQQTLQAMLTDGKAVARTGALAKLKKYKADHVMEERAADLKKAQELMKRAKREEVEAGRIEQHSKNSRDFQA